MSVQDQSDPLPVQIMKICNSILFQSASPRVHSLFGTNEGRIPYMNSLGWLHMRLIHVQAEIELQVQLFKMDIYSNLSLIYCPHPGECHQRVPYLNTPLARFGGLTNVIEWDMYKKQGQKKVKKRILLFQNGRGIKTDQRVVYGQLGLSNFAL